MSARSSNLGGNMIEIDSRWQNRLTGEVVTVMSFGDSNTVVVRGEHTGPGRDGFRFTLLESDFGRSKLYLPVH